MDSSEITDLHQKIYAGIRIAIAEAIERHRKLGQSISIWQDGKVVTLTADRIPPIQIENNIKTDILHDSQ